MMPQSSGPSTTGLDTLPTLPEAPFFTPSSSPYKFSSEEYGEEWEYEYSATETDTYYLTLDLTIPQLPLPRKAISRSKRSRWVNPGLGRQKRPNTQGPLTYKNEDHGEAETPAAQEDAEAKGDEDQEVEAQIMREIGNNGDESGLTGESNGQIQILDLHTTNPLVSYEGKLFTCEWAENIGTELLFTSHDPHDPLPVLRHLPGDVDLLAASSARLISRPVTADEKPKSTKRKRGHVRGLQIDIGNGSHPKRAEQAHFLQELIDIKEENGEEDLVTVFAQKKLTKLAWRKEFQARREQERAKLNKATRNSDPHVTAEANARLEMMDREDEERAIKEAVMKSQKGRPARAKKAGRKKKGDVMSEFVGVRILEAQESPKKRRVGRPRKNPKITAGEGNQLAFEEASTAASGQESQSTPVGESSMRDDIDEEEEGNEEINEEVDEDDEGRELDEEQFDDQEVDDGGGEVL